MQEAVEAGVRVDRYERWAHVELANPGRLNCMSLAMWGALEAAARELSRADGLRVVVLSGADGHFTSGFDLGELVDQSIDEVNLAFARMEAAIGAVEAIPVPVIAWLDGWCLGGGLELALAADLRWASPRVRIGMPVAKLGIMLSATFARRLVLAMGEAVAKDLLYTARSLPAAEALQAGVVSRILEPDAFGQARDAFIRSVARLYPRAVAQAKTSVGRTMPAPEDRTAYYVDAEDFRRAVAQFRR